MDNPSKPESLSAISQALHRHQLASIDLSDIEEDKELTDGERAEYVAAISAVWPRLEKDIKKFLHTQLLFAINETTSWEQILFARGTFNGMDLLLEHWRTAHNEHVAKGLPPEDFDKHDPIGEVVN